MKPGARRSVASGRRVIAVAPAGAVLALFVLGCDLREVEPREPVHADVAPILERACASCHGPERAEGGFRVDGYIETISCPDGSNSAVEPALDMSIESAPLLAVLETPDHVGLLTETEIALLTAWIEEGAPARDAAMHPAGWVDPRSPDFHGVALRNERWARMLEFGAPDSCARCHEGSPNDFGNIGAPGATSCTSCHREEGGPVACSTCHGMPGRAYPPRDPCWHPEEQSLGGAHATHVDVAGFDCTLCHGERNVGMLREDSEHGDGVVQIALDSARAGEGASWNPISRTCSTSCHDRGGTTPQPDWNDQLECGSCHTIPPEDHYAGSCNLCHAEAAADGSSLVPGPLHANGQVDLGDGSGTCGACHGVGEDPMPRTGSHAAHTLSSLSADLSCEECHVRPRDVHDAGHLDQTLGAEVTFGALASMRGATPSFDGSTCSGVACHGAGLGGGTFVQPTWGATDGRASACGACHGVPPPPPHTTLTNCSSTTCHGGIVGPGPSITAAGRALHVDGIVNYGEVNLWP